MYSHRPWYFEMRSFRPSGFGSLQFSRDQARTISKVLKMRFFQRDSSARRVVSLFDDSGPPQGVMAMPGRALEAIAPMFETEADGPSVEAEPKDS